MSIAGQVTVALGEYDIGWHDPAASIAAADRLASRAAEFAGGSVVFDAWGTRVPAIESSGVRVATLRASHARDIRSRYPFLRDRQA